MPEYLAPAVYVEETSFRAKSIEGVSTSTSGFAGPTLTGPSGGTPELLTSFSDFERIYGGASDLAYGSSSPGTNYLAHAVRAYFTEGGSRLYVSRVVPTGATAASVNFITNEANFVARFKGAAGNGTLYVEATLSPATGRNVASAPLGTVLRILTTNYLKTATGWTDGGSGSPTLPSDANESVGDFVTLLIRTTDGAGRTASYEGVGLDPLHPRWIGAVLSEAPSRQSEAIQRLYAVRFLDATPPDGLAMYTGLFPSGTTRTLTLTTGSDGAAPSTSDYDAALDVLAAVDDISIIAAPGSSAYDSTTAKGVRNSLIAHAEKRRAYRIAVLDTPPNQTHTQARAWRAEVDSTSAALYYPWVVVANPLARPGDEGTPREIALPPSGFVAGIYARTDSDRGVFKAPANETVRSALRFETDINFAQQEVLNPLGVNCLRFFPGRGYRVWGARTASSDPEWKYVNIRRYFSFLERSIDVGTQWAVFEPNGERLWANIRETIGSFLETQWRSGALLGTDTKQAFFVRCDRSTMTQDDLDNGRLICLVGVAAVKPAEFVIIRIGQKTADARS